MSRTPTAARRNGHAAPSRNGTHKPAKAPPAPSADGVNGPPAKGLDPVTGHFLPGNKLGKGNPNYRKLAATRTAFLEAVGPEQVKQLAHDLLRRALGGDLEAAKLVLSYGIGRPREAVDADAADLDEVRRSLAWPLDAQLVLAAVAGVEPARALEFLDGVAEVQAGRSILAGSEDVVRGAEQSTIVAALRQAVLAGRAKAT